MMESMHSSSIISSTTSSNNDNIDPDTKVLADINTLMDQINLCNDMLKMKGGVIDNSDDALLGVIGFLEACAPRMVDLVEAAAQGDLKESTLVTCLDVNDRLLKVLSDCDNEPGAAAVSAVTQTTPTAAAAAAAATAAAARSPLDVDLDDLLLDDTSGGGYKTSSKIGAGKFQAPPPTGPYKSDPFGGSTDLLVPTPASPLGDAKPPAAPANELDDEFDAFLRDRSTKTD